MDGLGVALGSPVEAGKIVADLGIFGLHRVGMCFGAYVPVFWQNIVGTIVVGGVHIRRESPHEHEPLQRFATTTADPEGHDVPDVSINSQPQPELPLFF